MLLPRFGQMQEDSESNRRWSHIFGLFSHFSPMSGYFFDNELFLHILWQKNDEESAALAESAPTLTTCFTVGGTRMSTVFLNLPKDEFPDHLTSSHALVRQRPVPDRFCCTRTPIYPSFGKEIRASVQISKEKCDESRKLDHKLLSETIRSKSTSSARHKARILEPSL